MAVPFCPTVEIEYDTEEKEKSHTYSDFHRHSANHVFAYSQMLPASRLSSCGLGNYVVARFDCTVQVGVRTAAMMEQAPRSDLRPWDGFQPWDDLSCKGRHPTNAAHPILCHHGEYPSQNHFGNFEDPCLDGDPGAILVCDADRSSQPSHDGHLPESLQLANAQTGCFCHHVEEDSRTRIPHKTMTYSLGHIDETILRETESIEHRDENGLTMGRDPSFRHTRIHLCLHCACGTHHARCTHACRHRGLHTEMYLDDESESWSLPYWYHKELY